jgi:hypothetical protein
MTVVDIETKKFGSAELTRRARFLTVEANCQSKFIRVFYREQLVADDGSVVNEGEVKSYELIDRPAVLYNAGEIITPEVRDEEGSIVSEAVVADGTEVKIPAITDFTDWDAQLGIPFIRPAIANRLRQIYGVVEPEVPEEE